MFLVVTSDLNRDDEFSVIECSTLAEAQKCMTEVENECYSKDSIYNGKILSIGSKVQLCIVLDEIESH